jgi:hypothetical protein
MKSSGTGYFRHYLFAMFREGLNTFSRHQAGMEGSVMRADNWG